MTPDIVRELTIDFLKKIGLNLVPEIGARGFLHGVAIHAGVLHYDPNKFMPSNLLHEAGHLACIPEQYRDLIEDNIETCFGAIRADIMANGLSAEPDHPLMRAFLQCSDPEATAWAWAAGHTIGLPPELVILDDEYQGSGALVRMSLMPSLTPGRSRVTGYVGIHGLAHAGFCALWTGQKLPMYPKLSHWLQPKINVEATTPANF
jgi:hypothetical protein